MMRRIFFFLIFYFSFLICPAWATVAGEVKRGNDLYRAGRFEEAVQKYDKVLKRKSESDIINFDLGTAYYKTKDYTRAAQHLQKALLSDDQNLRLKAQYNLGNALYHVGLGQEKTSPEGAAQSWKLALAAYERVLEADPKDEDARYNAEIVRKKLKQLEKEQKESKQCPNPKKSDSGQGQAQKQEQKSEEQKGQAQQTKDEQAQEQKAQEQEAQQGEEKKDEGTQEGKPFSAQPMNEEVGERKDENKTQPTAEEMKKKDAQMLLRDYQEREEPRGLLNFQARESSNEKPVTKDW